MKTKFILLFACVCALLSSCTTQTRADRPQLMLDYLRSRKLHE